MEKQTRRDRCQQPTHQSRWESYYPRYFLLAACPQVAGRALHVSTGWHPFPNENSHLWHCCALILKSVSTDLWMFPYLLPLFLPCCFFTVSLFACERALVSYKSEKCDGRSLWWGIVHSLNWCSSIITANLTGSGFCQLKREIISTNSFSNLMLNSTLKCTGLKIPINAHFQTIKVLVAHKAF